MIRPIPGRSRETSSDARLSRCAWRDTLFSEDNERHLRQLGRPLSLLGSRFVLGNDVLRGGAGELWTKSRIVVSTPLH